MSTFLIINNELINLNKVINIERTADCFHVMLPHRTFNLPLTDENILRECLSHRGLNFEF